VDPEGNLCIAAREDNRIYKAARADSSDNLIPDDNGVGYLMDLDTGKHLETRYLDTGMTLTTFNYDGNDDLTSVTDRFDNEVTTRPPYAHDIRANSHCR
jgi:YD repeat-containing protein